MYDYDVEAQEVESKEDDLPENEMPSANHSYICSRILRQLFFNEEIEPFPELTLDIGKGLTPDISIYPKGSFKPNFRRDIIKYTELPLLAIEVISPTQGVQELLEKSRMMVQNGIRTVWTIEPFGETIFVTTKDGETVFHNQTVESEGISVDFKQIFDESQS